jgi:hypothetical protein
VENGVFVANPLQERTILMRKEGESAKSINEMLLSRLSRYRASPSATLAALTGSTISNTLKEDQAGALSFPDHLHRVGAAMCPAYLPCASGLWAPWSPAAALPYLELSPPSLSGKVCRKMQLATAVHNTVLALRKLRQKDHELEVSLHYVRSPQILPHALKKKKILDLS